MPKVTIVLPTYNGEKYIKEAIDSIINQTFLDWELIIVDDCSNDFTPKIVEEYAQKDNRIKVIHNEINKKLPEALNIGFRKAKGEYFTWTSDDNVYLPNAISVMVNILDDDEKIFMTCADMEIIDQIGIRKKYAKPYDNSLIFIENNVGACFLYRSYVRNEIGEYDTNMFLVEDYDYWLRIRSKYGNIYRIDKVLYKYREHSASLTATKSSLVSKQLNKLHLKYIDDIFINLSDNKRCLAKVYYDLVSNMRIEDKIAQEFYKYVPELTYEMRWLKGEERKNFIVFGAGEIGREVNLLLGDKVRYFVDNDKAKVGTIIDGVKVLGIGGAKELVNEYDILIAVSTLNIFDIIDELCKNGIYNFISWPVYKSRCEE